MTPTTPEGQLRIPRYDLGAEIGRGATSVVYRATQGSQRFAVKVTKPSARTGPQGTEAALRFRREGAALAMLDHPGLVKVAEVGEAGDLSYLVMELVEGESLAAVLERGPLDRPRVLALARQLASALGEVHRHGLVHRDLKPGNVVLGVDGGAKLLDFGFVTQADVVKGGEGSALGTFLYAPPEQTGMLKRTVDGRSDLYSLGVMLFECATGKPPFDTDVVAELMRLHAVTAPPTLLSVRPEMGPALSAIIAKLLAKDPDDRYQTSEGLAADLDAIDALDDAARKNALVLGARDLRRRAGQGLPLVGREDELHVLRTAWSRALGGRGAMVTVTGEAGSGKTRLTRELLEVARGDGAVVLSGKCNAADVLPLGALREAMNELLAWADGRPADERGKVHEAVRTAAQGWSRQVRRLSPAVDRVLGEVVDVVPLNPSHEQERFYEAVAVFFAALAKALGKVVLLIDDLQWADEATVKVLGQLVDGLGSVPMLVLATARTEEPRPGLEALVTSAPPKLQTLALTPLDGGSASELVKALLGNKPVDQAVEERLLALARGNPFALSTYVTTLLEAGVLTPVAGAWRGDAAKLAALDLPSDVVKLVLSRLRTLSAESLGRLSLAAVLGGRFSAAVLATVAQASPAEVLGTLQEAVAANLVEHTQGDEHAFVHDRVREALLERLSPEQARDAHQAAAEALEGNATQPEQIFALARHAALGHRERDAKRVFAANAKAGALALEQFANVEALELLETALEEAGPAGATNAQLRELCIGLAGACARLGRHAQGYAHLEKAMERSQSPLERGHVQILVAGMRLSEGDTARTWEDVKVAYELMEAPFPKSPKAQFFVTVGGLFKALFQLRFGIGFGTAQGEERVKRELLSVANTLGSSAAYFLGQPMLMVQLIVREMLNSHPLGASRQNALARAFFGFLLALFGMKKAALQHAQGGLAMAQQLGDGPSAAWAQNLNALTLEATGDVINSEPMMAQVIPLTDRYLGSYERCNCRTEHVYQWLLRGYSSRVAEIGARYLPVVDRLNSILFRANLRGAMYSQLALMGRLQEALKLKGEWLEIAKYLPNVPFAQCYVHALQLQVLVDQQEYGPELDGHIDAFLALKADEYHNRFAYTLVAEARLGQLRRAAPDARPAAVERLKKALADTKTRAVTPLHQGPQHAVKAALATELGRFSEAQALLAQAEKFATQADSPLAAVMVAEERARLAAKQGARTEVLEHAKAAIAICKAQQWRPRQRRLEAEFAIEETRTRSASGAGSISASRSGQLASRQVDALLKVSLATAGSLDPETQARATLDTIVSLLGAERGFIFVKNTEGELRPLAGRDATGKDLAALEGYSSTVVQKVFREATPLVVTGTDEGEVLGSASAVAHDLRSIMAAPVKLRDETLGVVYVDSHLAKGLFTNEDTDILSALASHIATAFEASRVARLEAQRLSLEKDLALTGAVQSFFLPKTPSATFGQVKVHGLFRPAAQCAGDWWSYEPLPEGGVRVLVGDLTGHGAAPAMLTAAIATTLRWHRKGKSDLRTVLEAISAELLEVTQGAYQMPLSALELDAEGRTLKVVSAAAPPVMVLPPEGAPQVMVRPGVALGASGFAPEVLEVKLAPGSRVLAYTDGLLEFPRKDGRTTRHRHLADWLAATRGQSGEAAQAALAAHLDGLRTPGPLEDDVTFVLVDV